jgi:hypothetical protein
MSSPKTRLTTSGMSSLPAKMMASTTITPTAVAARTGHGGGFRLAELGTQDFLGSQVRRSGSDGGP